MSVFSQENPFRSAPWERRRLPLALVAIPLFAALFGIFMAGMGLGHQPAQIRYKTVTLPPGATRVEAGVPVGYARSQPGAVNAATAYTVVMNGPLLLQKDDLKKAAGAIATGGYHDQAIAAADQNVKALNSAYGVDTNASLGAAPQIQFVPTSYHVESFDDAHAKVSIWGVWIVAEQGVLAPQENWLTTTVSLDWESGDWKLANASSSPGPAPAARSGGGEPSSSPLPASMTDYQPYTHVSDGGGH